MKPDFEQKKIKKPYIGVSGFFSELLHKIDFFELDFYSHFFENRNNLDSLLNKINPHHFLVIRALHIFTQKNIFSYETEEKVQLLMERCHEAQAQVCLIKIPTSYFLEDPECLRLQKIHSYWLKNIPHCLLYFCPGKHSPHKINVPIILDPLWEDHFHSSQFWRIHGWHMNRWVRLYSLEQLKELKNKAEIYSPQYILFHHSQKKTQSLQYLKII